MDFTENYACKSIEEIQSAYWNQCAVTLHPVVIYFKSITSDLKHNSILKVSDEKGHNSNAVLTFLYKIVPDIKKCLSNVRKVHYFMDSPTSKYRDKTIFHVVAYHKEINDCKATWNYFEVGHGKGPCDGLGGTTKGWLMMQLKQKRQPFKMEKSFFSGNSLQVVQSKDAHFMFVPTFNCQQMSCSLNMYDIRSIKGTMKLHAMVGQGNNTIWTSCVNCYCKDCISDEECKVNHLTDCTTDISNKSSVMRDEN